ncbi:Taste receptor type 2 member 9, partial [Apaloderma vittatum]
NVTSYRTTATVLITFQAFAGLWINAFIISMLSISWVKKRSFSSFEKILLFLGCCRFLYLCISWVYTFLVSIYSWCIFVHPIPQLLAAIQSFFVASNLWVSACLCGFYCIKIVNFRHIFFIYLKAKIDKIVPYLFLSSVFLSLIFSIVAYDMTDKTLYNYFNSTRQGDSWKLTIRMDEHTMALLVIFSFVFSSAFMVVISSALLLLFSLWRHKSNMQTKSVKNISVVAHIKAMKNIMLFLFLYTSNFTCLILTVIHLLKQDDFVTFFILVFQYVFPVVHSLNLILSNPKLEKTLLKTL